MVLSAVVCELFLRVLTVAILTVWTTNASTKLTGPREACLGRPVNLTCDVSDDLTNTQITWRRPGNIVVVTCQPDGQCFPVSSNYDVTWTPTRQILNIQKFGTEDVGDWRCTAAGTNSTKPLSVRSLDTPKLSSLRVNCSREANMGDFLIMCEGLISRGSPPANLLLNADSPSFKKRACKDLQCNYITADTSLAGAEVTCSVSGQAARCVKNSPISVSAKCPGHKKGRITTGIMVLIIIVVIVVILLGFFLVDRFFFYPKQKGPTYFLKGKFCGNKGTSSQQASSKKVDKTDAKKTESGAVEVPLMDGDMVFMTNLSVSHKEGLTWYLKKEMTVF